MDQDRGHDDLTVNVLGETVYVRVAWTSWSVKEWIREYASYDEEYGIDVEWRPNGPGERNRVALLQLAGANGCLIVRMMYITWIPRNLQLLLARAKLAGVGVQADARKLYEDYDLDCRNLVDLRNYAAQVVQDRRLKNAGLATLCSAVLNCPLQKNSYTTRSDWAAEYLTPAQIQYAATDAHVAYRMLCELEEQQGPDY